MKHGKLRLIVSITFLAAALALAVFTVYAWFVSKTQANADIFDTNVTSGDVKSFTITYYNATSEDGLTFVMGEQITKDDKGMEPYSPRFGNKTETAVLLKIDLEFSTTGKYELSANTGGAGVYDIDDFTNFSTKNRLSNVVYLQKVSAVSGSGVNFSVGSNAQKNFITDDKGVTTYFDGANDDAKKHTSVTLDEINGNSGKMTIYFIMDYIGRQIDALYSIMLSATDDSFAAAKLDTEILFLKDITFSVGRAD